MRIFLIAFLILFTSSLWANDCVNAKAEDIVKEREIDNLMFVIRFGSLEGGGLYEAVVRVDQIRSERKTLAKIIKECGE